MRHRENPGPAMRRQPRTLAESAESHGEVEPPKYQAIKKLAAAAEKVHRLADEHMKKLGHRRQS